MPDQKITNLEATPGPESKTTAKKHFFRASAADFKKIPGSPIAYWIKQKVMESFDRDLPLGDEFPVKSGIMTGNDQKFLRFWFEVAQIKISFGLFDFTEMRGFWYPLSKGGSFRKWFGNNEQIINLRDDGFDIKNDDGNFRLREKSWYFKPYITWSRISSSSIAFRFLKGGVLFADAAPGIFAKEECIRIIGLLNSKLGNYFLRIINPTLNYQTNDIERIPSIYVQNRYCGGQCIEIATNDWDSYETSWDFAELPLLKAEYKQNSLEQTYALVREHWKQMCIEMKQLEEENNRIFIEAYGLQDELTPDVPWREITLTCNPFYRYSKKAETAEDSDDEASEDNEEFNAGADTEEDSNSGSSPEFPVDSDLEERLLGDSMRELISYAVGCMFGRYSLDKPGLILADQGQTLEDYLQQIPEPSFMPDRENVLPVLEDEYFTDDIAERFKKFIKTAFGESHYQKNLDFIEKAIGKDIRRYFVKDFYNDHVKRYKKRPIYWLFSSPGGSFNALIYLHRYRPDTVSQVLNNYLRVYIEKINTRNRDLEQVKISGSASPREQNQAAKEIEKNRKILRELDAYEREVVFPLAAKRLEIDLDNGVKKNYPLLGKALKKITGL